MSKVYDVVIIGSGPAGLSAAIYAARAGISQVVLERNPMSGGQMTLTDKIENYPGVISVDGFTLGMTMRQQAEELGAQFLSAEANDLRRDGDIWRVGTSNGELLAKNVVYAAGADHRHLGVKNEEKFIGRGVSYCANCDGNFYRNKVVAVVGGGNTALQDALYLSKLAKKVYLIHRRDGFRGLPSTLNAVREKENIEIITGRTVKEIVGEMKVNKVILQEGTEEREHLEIDGIFIAVGVVPNNQLVNDFIQKDGAGFALTDEDCKAAEGLYVAGDGRSKKFRQVVTATADGAIAVMAILEKY